MKALLFYSGVFFLIAGLTVSLLFREEEAVYLAPGEAERLKAGIVVQLIDTEELRDENGTLINWESTLRIQVPQAEPQTKSVRVNKPLSIPPYRLYQNDYERRPAVQLKPGTGTLREPVLLAVNEGFRDDEMFWVLTHQNADPRRPNAQKDLNLDSFYFAGYKGGTPPDRNNQNASMGKRTADRLSLREGASRLNLQPVEAEYKPVSGLQLVYDPGALPAALGGLLLTGAMVGLIFENRHRLRRPVRTEEYTS